jgi:hypothetical protein
MSERRSSWEPRRWSEATSDAPDVLRAALQDARDAGVDSIGSERVVRLAQRLGVGGGVAAGVGLASLGDVSSMGVGASGVVAYKLWAALSGVVAVSGVALLIWGTRAPGAPLHADAVGVPVAAEHELARAVGGVLVTSGGHPIAQPLLVPAVEAVVPELIANASHSTARASVRRRQLSAEDTPRAPVVGGKLDAQAELAILNRAQDALAHAPTRALLLAEDHARAFPNGVFAQEREVIAIEALIKLQRSDAATARGRAFLSVFPTSTHAPRVQQMLGE